MPNKCIIMLTCYVYFCSTYNSGHCLTSYNAYISPYVKYFHDHIVGCDQSMWWITLCVGNSRPLTWLLVWVKWFQYAAFLLHTSLTCYMLEDVLTPYVAIHPRISAVREPRANPTVLILLIVRRRNIGIQQMAFIHLSPSRNHGTN